MAVSEQWNGDEIAEMLDRGVALGLQAVAQDWLEAWSEEWDPQRHPYMTGHSRDEGTAVVSRDGNTTTVTFASSPDYLVYEELGSDHQSAHHPMLRSVDAVTPAAPQHILDAIEGEGIAAGSARVDVVGGVSKTRLAFE